VARTPLCTFSHRGMPLSPSLPFPFAFHRLLPLPSRALLFSRGSGCRCAYCKGFEPVFHQLANAARNDETLQIARMDATKNEIDHPRVRVRAPFISVSCLLGLVAFCLSLFHFHAPPSTNCSF